jgi:hypothetical protein
VDRRWLLDYRGTYIVTTLIASALVGLVSGIAASAVSHLLILRRIRGEALQRLEFGLHEKQAEAYQELWSHLGPTSRYCPTEDSNRLVKLDGSGYYLDSKNVISFFESLNDYFYSRHGIFLSKRLRSALFEVREFYEKTVKETSPDEDGKIRLSNKKAKKCHHAWDWIRTLLRHDIGLRDVEFPIGLKDLESPGKGERGQ